jgi:5'-methylthioinosine phosphorylase
MIAIVGGSGLNELQDFTLVNRESITTDYSTDPVLVNRGFLQGVEVLFLPRHGSGHTIPPHCINYRSNIAALKYLRTEAIIAVNAVGGIHPELGPGKIAVPSQIIDYSWGREHTFSDGTEAGVLHVDFTEPYDEKLRQLLLTSSQQTGVSVWPQGVYGCTQGPRLESAAEVRRLLQDGCDMIGMTGMPEAALARELEIPYACIALSVNWAAGISEDMISMASIYRVLDSGMGLIQTVLNQTIKHWRQESP